MRANTLKKCVASHAVADITIDGARGILFNVTGGTDLTLFEVNQAAAIIKETAHPDVNLIFGAVIDPNMGEEIRVTVIATGFESSGIPRNLLERSKPRLVPATVKEEQPVNSNEFQPRPFNTEDLDIPTFLRYRLREND